MLKSRQQVPADIAFNKTFNEAKVHMQISDKEYAFRIDLDELEQLLQTKGEVIRKITL